MKKLFGRKYDVVRFNNDKYGVRVMRLFFGIPILVGYLDKDTDHIWGLDEHVRRWACHETRDLAEDRKSKILHVQFVLPLKVVKVFD